MYSSWSLFETLADGVYRSISHYVYSIYYRIWLRSLLIVPRVVLDAVFSSQSHARGEEKKDESDTWDDGGQQQLDKSKTEKAVVVSSEIMAPSTGLNG